MLPSKSPRTLCVLSLSFFAANPPSQNIQLSIKSLENHSHHFSFFCYCFHLFETTKNDRICGQNVVPIGYVRIIFRVQQKMHKVFQS